MLLATGTTQPLQSTHNNIRSILAHLPKPEHRLEQRRLDSIKLIYNNNVITINCNNCLTHTQYNQATEILVSGGVVDGHDGRTDGRTDGRNPIPQLPRYM
jgi:hypothetical protein